MNLIHVASPSGDQKQHNEAELRSLWEAGLLVKGTRYWKEGMPAWRPVEELFANGLTEIAPPPPLPAPSFAYTKDPRALTRFLLAMLWTGLGVEIVAMVSDFSQLMMLGRSFTEDEAAANDLRQGLIGFSFLGVFIVTAIVFLKWIHRANLNCRGFGADDLRHTPGWAVGYYFIPFLNLVRPYQAMKEIWQASRNPKDWRSEPGSQLLGWWWGLWLISGALGQILFRVTLDADSIEELKATTVISLVSGFIDVALSLVAIWLVRAIAQRQEQLIQGSFR